MAAVPTGNAGDGRGVRLRSSLVWEWYDWRRTMIARCAPNAAHRVLARWSRSLGSTTVTQNVDDLHLLAGTASLVRLHGSIWELSCRHRCALAGASRWRDERVPLPELPPRCPHCAGPARPAVVWFGESLDQRDLDHGLAATQCDVFVTIGTSSVVYPAAGLVHAAARAGAFTVEINPESTDASPFVDLAISARAETLLPELDAALTSGR